MASCLSPGIGWTKPVTRHRMNEHLWHFRSNLGAQPLEIAQIRYNREIVAKGKRKGTNQESPPLYPEVKDAPKDTGSMIDGRRSSLPGRRSSWYNRRLFFNPRRRPRPYTPGSVHPASASRAFPALRSKRPPHSGSHDLCRWRSRARTLGWSGEVGRSGAGLVKNIGRPIWLSKEIERSRVNLVCTFLMLFFSMCIL